MFKKTKAPSTRAAEDAARDMGQHQIPDACVLEMLDHGKESRRGVERETRERVEGGKLIKGSLVGN